MTDIARLGLAVDSSQVTKANTALDQMAASGKAAQQSATALGTASAKSAQHVKSLQTSSGLARHEMINLSRQAQDVGVSLASGQSPLMVLAQQGTQIADIFSSSNGSFRGFLGQVRSAITPMRLLAGGLALVGTAAVLGYSSWKGYATQLDDAARAADTTTDSLSRLQGAAAGKGISSSNFFEGMEQFSRSVYQARNNMGGLADVFRANNKHAQSFDEYLERAADLIKNAASDQQRLALLQQMGLPATMQWVRFLSEGADGIRRAKEEMAGVAAGNDELLRKAKQFDEEWNKSWANFVLQGRGAVVDVLGYLDWLDKKGNGLLISGGMDPGTLGRNLLKSGYGDRMIGSAEAGRYYGAVGMRAASGSGGTVDPNAARQTLALEQQRLSILGQMASVEQQSLAVKKAIDQARLNGIHITETEEAKLRSLAEAQALGLTQIRATADAYRMEAATVGMSTREATSYLAVQNAINQAKRDGRPLTEENIAAIRREGDALGAAAAQADMMKFGYENLVRGPLQQFRAELANGATFFEALKRSGLSALDAISSKLIDMAASNLFSSAFSSGGGGFLSSLFGGLFGGGGSSGLFQGGFGGARAGGGPVEAGRAYLVGEKRPELFVPNANGMIVPKVPDGLGGAGPRIVIGDTHITVNGNADDKAIAQLRRELAQDRANRKSEIIATVRQARTARAL